MNWYKKTCPSPCEKSKKAAQDRQACLTKPPGSLGRLESLAIEIASLQHSEQPKLENIEIAIFAGDHGVVDEGISAFPQAVTAEMIRNFVNGGAAISVLARQINANLNVINTGVASGERFDPPVLDFSLARGTENLLHQAAMSEQLLEEAMAIGLKVQQGFKNKPHLAIGGDMGIGNTTSATALAAVITETDPENIVGPGTGLDSAGVRHKLETIRRAIQRANITLEDNDSYLLLLRELGGLEIAALCGYYIACAQNAIPVLLDGFITTSAALVAVGINPSIRPWLLFSHSSAESGHRYMIDHLQGQTILDLGMRLGEGSGAATTVNLLKSACMLHNEMATFEQASVSGKL